MLKYNLLENTPNQPSKFRTKNWVEVNDESRGTYSVNSQIKFKTLMLRSRSAGADPNNRKNIIIKNCAPFTNCTSEINNTQRDNAKDIDIVKPMYYLKEYSDNYSKTSAGLWNYYRDEPYLNADGAIADFPANNNNKASFKFKTKLVGRIEKNGTKHVKIRVPLKYLSNFGRTLEMALINCEITFILTWSNRFFIIDKPIYGEEPTFTTTDTKLYVPVVTLSTQVPYT